VYRLKPLIELFEIAAKSLSVAIPRLIIYPDGAAGLIYDSKAKMWLPKDSGEQPLEQEPSELTKSWDHEVCDIVREVQERGFWRGILVGGCCKTTPDDIAHLRHRLDRLHIPQ